MSAQEIANFCCDHIDIDVAEFLKVICLIDQGDTSAISRLRPCLAAVAALDAQRPTGITIARTFHGTALSRSAELRCPRDNYLITISLAKTNILLANNDKTLVEGWLSAGTICVTGPGERLVMQSQMGCDLLHLAVPAPIMHRSARGRPNLEGLVLSDPLIGRIGHLLGEGPAEWLRVYAELLCQLAVARLLQLAPRMPISGLPAWRLKKVQTYVDTNIDEPLRLSDLAAVVGLSRMHFAARFRAATGMRPREYVLSRRIARAKELMAVYDGTLVKIALDAGFQSQAHFCTVFKRLSGITPSTWRRQLSFARDLQLGNPPRGRFPDGIPAAAVAPLFFAVHAAGL